MSHLVVPLLALASALEDASIVGVDLCDLEDVPQVFDREDRGQGFERRFPGRYRVAYEWRDVGVFDESWCANSAVFEAHQVQNSSTMEKFI